MKVAFLGLGAMGEHMAVSLLKAGVDLTVWNRTTNRTTSLHAQGAKVAALPSEAVTNADFVIAMLRDDDASRDVWTHASYGALEAMKAGAVAIESSTLTLTWVRQLAVLAAARHISLLDAPVAGSTPAAESKQLIYLVGGDAAVLERAKPVLSAIGSAIHYAGPSGSGAIVKLIVNSLLGIQAAALAELIGMAERNGVNIAQALEIVGSTPVSSPAIKSMASAMLAKQFAPMFPIELFEKDISYVLACANDVKAQTPLIRATHSVLKAAMDAGWAQEQYTAVIKLYR